MNSRAKIQYKAPHRTPDGLAWEAGVLVPTTAPIVDEPSGCDGISIEHAIDLFLFGAPSLKQIGTRVVVLAYLMPHSQCRPTSLRELGLLLGCSHTEAARRCSAIRADFAKELANFAPEMLQRSPE